MQALYYLIDVVFDLYMMIIMLRLWLQLARADFYNPFSQFIVKVSQPALAPLRRIIPPIGNVDSASLVLAYLVSLGKLVLLITLSGGTAVPSLAVLVVAFFMFLKQFLMMVFWILIIRAVMSWISQGRSPVEYVLGQLTEPFLSPIRRIIPSIGGLDFSMLVAIIILQFLMKLIPSIS